MIKSIIIKDKNGRLILKVICRKSGEYEVIKDISVHGLDIEVRNEKNEKVIFEKGE